MKIVLQRVKQAAVVVDGEKISEVERGFLILLGAEKGDDENRLQYWVDKCVGLRVFEDEQGKMNLAIGDAGGEMLVVSQFTLCADIARGRRPSFDKAMPPEQAEKMYEDFCNKVADKGIKVKRGRFGAKMNVELVNDGPVTLILAD